MSASYALGAILIGFAASILSGMFGIGGAVVTTPSIRVFLGATPAIALGTPLAVTIPSAAAGALTYRRRGLVSAKAAFFAGFAGLFGAVSGALLTRIIDLHYLMLVTGVLVLYVSFSMVRRGIAESSGASVSGVAAIEEAPENPATSSDQNRSRESAGFALVIGLTAGLFSGLLGVGGGFILVPGFFYFMKMPLKKAFGTSLAVIAVIAVPGTIVHSLLGHVSWVLAGFLMIGAIPGAYLGAHITIRTAEKVLYILFSLLIASLGVVFIINEIMALVS